MSSEPDDRHPFMPQPGCNICVCGHPKDDPFHTSVCNHGGQGCPVHAHVWTSEHIDMVTVIECLYGGAETKAGTPFDRADAEEVWARVMRRLGG